MASPSSLMATAATRSIPFLKPTALFLLAALISRRSSALIPNRRRRSSANYSQFRPWKLATSVKSKFRISAAAAYPDPNFLSGPTRTAATLAALALTASKPSARELFGQLMDPGTGLFAAARVSSRLNTPLTVVARGLAKWLELYRSVMKVMCVLSWYPNVPWERQPFSAMRDLCLPLMRPFRDIIPPLYGVLDCSPVFAHALLSTMIAILHKSSQF